MFFCNMKVLLSYQNMKKISVFVFGLLLLASCGDEPKDELGGPPKEEEVEVKSISTDFASNAFDSKVEEKLLTELSICDPKAPNDTDEKRPSCSPNFFRFFPLNDKIKLDNGFILLVKAGVNNFPLRRILIFEREKGELIKLNGFNGNLIERRPTPSGYDDLLVRFTDNIEGSLCYYNCWFSWNGGQYQYVNCEAIQEGGQEAPHRIKAEYIDTMAVEIKKILDKNKMIF